MQSFGNAYPELGVSSLGGRDPLPPESRKGWLIVLAALAVLGFGMMAFGILSNGLQSFTERENLNTALEIESHMRGALLAIRQMQEQGHGYNRPIFQAHRTNYGRFYEQFTPAAKADPLNLPLLQGLDSAVHLFFAHGESLLQLNDRISRGRSQGEPDRKLREFLELKKNHLASTRFSFLKANEGLQAIENNLQGQRKELLTLQLGLFKRLYLVTAVSLVFGIVVVWLLVRVRAGQKRERSVTESLSQTLVEIKAAEEALRQSNERFHLAASATSGVIYDWDIEKNIIVWTENIDAVFGYELEEVEPSFAWWEERLHPADLTRIQTQLQGNLEAGKDFIGEYRFRHKDGHYIDVWDKGRLVRDPSGKVARMVGSMVDVSEQKRVEKALRAIAEGISSSTGVNFFRSLVRHLASALGVKYALVAEVTDEKQERVRTVAVWTGDDYAENFEYALAGTPCENVVGKSLCLYPSGIQGQFPDDAILKEMRAESYLGTPLMDSNGRPLGILAVLHTEPMADEYDLRSILNIFAARAAAELERKRT
ncbi:MAG: PAS domain-containing protein, partial [candidate division Zixibacteria bacterium]|nr:PAS domain-containing protein [candidate division Zixibacteria bacterium]